MRLTILTIGTRGDVQLYIALARGLEASGHTVCLAAGPEHETFVRSMGLAFAPIRGWLLARKTDQLRDCWAAAQGSDAVLGGYTVLGAAQSVAEKLGVPFLRCVGFPLAATRAF